MLLDLGNNVQVLIFETPVILQRVEMDGRDGV